MSLPNHGANPQLLLKKLGKDMPKQLLDFSENTNPFGPPSFFANLHVNTLYKSMTQYPDPEVTDVSIKLAFKNNVSVKSMLVGNGAAELIFLIANLFQGKRVGIVEPAFSEYRDACQAFGCKVKSIILPSPWQLDIELVLSSFCQIDVLFLCSPNNPTGVLYREKDVICLLEAAEEHGVYVVLDEAFYDFSEENAGLHHLLNEFSRLILLRSLTKMFAIAGIRLGYMMANADIIKELKKRQPPWSVNGIAQQIGLCLLNEDSFVKQTIANIHRERKRVAELLRDLNYFISDSTVNFYLLAEKERKDLMPLLVFLAEKGIVARHTYNFNGLNGCYLRFAVKDSQSNDRLIATLTEWRKR